MWSEKDRYPQPQPPEQRRDWWPPELEKVVADYHVILPGWDIWLAEEYEPPLDGSGAGGLKLYFRSWTPDSYNVERMIGVRHEFLVPRASYAYKVWEAWVFDRYVDCWRHEAGETLLRGEDRPFGPHHGDGENPYRTVQADGGDLADTRVRSGETREEYDERVSTEAKPVYSGQ